MSHFGPTSYQNKQLEGADLSVQSCQATLARLGLSIEAAQLGVVSVTDCVIARITLKILKSIKTSNAEASEAIQGAVSSLEGALTHCGGLAAA